MFDEHSFGEEITNAKEAESCVQYLAGNETKFRSELYKEGLNYDEIQDKIATVWRNLLKSCKRVGFSNYVTEAKAKQFK